MVLVFVLNSINNHIAATRAAVIVSAVKAFYDTNGHYPESPIDLTPEFIDHIPLAKYTLGQNTFYYRVAEGWGRVVLREVSPIRSRDLSVLRRQVGLH